jgi:Reverse transcriptase (RNA-dependent DNA polymerase)/GIY-YIG catalytic domain
MARHPLPKIHKPGNKIRPVVTTIDSPTSRIADYLLKSFRSFEKFESRSVKNNTDFVKELQDLTIEDDFELVSFDVCSLFPSIPENEAVSMLKEWICDQDIGNKHAELLCELLDIVSSQKFFQFDNIIYKQNGGVEIGGKLSPMIAEIFMSRLETKVLRIPGTPKIYFRFVDDIFAVIKKGMGNDVLKLFNEMHPKIEFTMESESEGKIPFLDLLIGRDKNKFTFEIYHKPSDVNQCVPMESFAPMIYKLASFENKFHRLFNVPLTPEGFIKERDRIYDMARMNGYERKVVEKIERKQMNKKERKSILSTLSREKNRKEINPSAKLMLLTFYPPSTEKIVKSARKNGMNAIYTGKGTLGDNLVNLKDKREDEMKSGIYQIECEDCDEVYIGQSRRRVQERWKEHDAAYRLNQPRKSAVAEHAIVSGHKIGEKKLLKEVTNNFELNAWESSFIANKILLMNLEDAPIRSELFSLSSH